MCPLKKHITAISVLYGPQILVDIVLNLICLRIFFMGSNITWIAIVINWKQGSGFTGLFNTEEHSGVTLHL